MKQLRNNGITHVKDRQFSFLGIIGFTLATILWSLKEHGFLKIAKSARRQESLDMEKRMTRLPCFSAITFYSSSHSRTNAYGNNLHAEVMGVFLFLCASALASPEALCPSSTFDFGRKPTSATVTNAFPVVNVGDADLALGDAWRRVRQRRSRPRFFGHGCKISATIVS